MALSLYGIVLVQESQTYCPAPERVKSTFVGEVTNALSADVEVSVKVLASAEEATA